jgi:phytoene synthase
MSTTVDPRSAADVAQRSRSSFLVSFGALAPERRRALTAIYAFCRVVDDAVDRDGEPEERRAHLQFWRDELDRAYGGDPHTGIGRELRHAVRRYDVARRHLDAVCAGVAMDLEPVVFGTLEELEGYCYKVASAVGLACLPVFGASGQAAGEYAVRLGLAMQLTNVARDLSTDARAGRVYAPREWLGEEGIEPAWLAGDGPPAAYRRGGPIDCLVRRLAAVAREHFAQAEAVLPAEHRAALLAPQIMAAVYQDLLRRIGRRGGDLRRSRPPRVPRWRRLLLAWRVRARCRG